MLTQEDLIFNLASSYGISDATHKIKDRGFEHEKYITIDMFIDILKPSWVVVPKTVKNNLRNQYEKKF